jgi:hypothetical protein
VVKYNSKGKRKNSKVKIQKEKLKIKKLPTHHPELKTIN